NNASQSATAGNARVSAVGRFAFNARSCRNAANAATAAMVTNAYVATETAMCTATQVVACPEVPGFCGACCQTAASTATTIRYPAISGASRQAWRSNAATRPNTAMLAATVVHNVVEKSARQTPPVRTATSA